MEADRKSQGPRYAAWFSTSCECFRKSATTGDDNRPTYRISAWPLRTTFSPKADLSPALPSSQAGPIRPLTSHAGAIEKGQTKLPFLAVEGRRPLGNAVHPSRPRAFPVQVDPARTPSRPPIGYPRIGWSGGGAGRCRVNLTKRCSNPSAPCEIPKVSFQRRLGTPD